MVGVPMAATEDFHYKVELKPYSVSGEQYETDFTTMSDWSRIVEWTTLKNDTGVLKPNQKQDVKFMIKVPENAPAGGQYMALGVTSDNPLEQGEGFAVQNIYEMASLVYAEVAGKTTHAGQIVENQIPGFVSTDKPYVAAKFANTGNVHEIAKTTITVKNNFTGETIFPSQGENENFESVIMPETTRVVKRELTNLPAIGIFEVTQNISYMGTDNNVTTVMIICPIWFIALIIATIIAIFGTIFLIFRSKHKKAEKVVDF